MVQLGHEKQNSLILAGGAGQIPQANAINGKSRQMSTITIRNSSGNAGGDARIPQANAINDSSQSLMKDTSPYSAFNLLLDRQDELMELEKLAQ